MFDELANAGRENVDADHVRLYDEKEDAQAAAEVELLVGLGLGPGLVLVDLGAGTGQFALEAARTGASVIAVDVSPVMLERLRAKAIGAGLDSIRVVEAGFLAYQHEGPPADFVYSRWALHHLPDFWKALALSRMRAVLRPAGVLRLCDIAFSFPPHQAADRIAGWRATLPPAAGPGNWVRSDLDDHIRDEHSTFTWLLEPMMQHAGFRIDQADYSADGFFASYIAHAI
jgi:ubiquinone/menaquinone biosynthesis C-methylase UbiE